LNSTHTPKLTSAEIAALWTQYVNETAGICFHKHMMEYIEDKEIKNVFEYAMSLGSKHLKKSILAKAVIIAFRQVAKSKKVQNFLSKALNTKDNHIQMFHNTLSNEHLPSPSTLDAEITDSTTSPFSDKLMMFLK